MPFATFFLPEPPHGITRIPKDLRRHAGGVEEEVDSNILLDVRGSWERREIALELLASSGGRAVRFGFSATISEDPEESGARLREVLGVELEEQVRWRDGRIGFNRLRAAAEGAGVLVLQTSDIELSALRAYSLAADELPVVVVNRKDAYAARSFSLLHELAHIGLKSEGICDLSTDSSMPPEEQQLEVFCNAVAAAALIPRDALLRLPDVRRHDGQTWDDAAIASLAKTFSCSREAILRRLLTFGLTTERFYQQKRSQWQLEYESRPAPGGFVPPPIDAVSLLGRPLVRLVLDGLSNDRITTSDAADYLGVRSKHLPAIADAVGANDS
ncbi:ImmA/IrrE family metallo-endopeptidase [Gemmatimonas sp. UBA7669]|uniref:ImmA/IrrE family metallo-endopeptidase n=1 Tax=Gemmatimonas sp. UBA7669 TaxID=1946568 RepID=UPI0025C18E17|nr:ImmA/IrrE family metallo-endopeptidase [Gemmatimonas sp. UBA7669]